MQHNIRIDRFGMRCSDTLDSLVILIIGLENTSPRGITAHPNDESSSPVASGDRRRISTLRGSSSRRALN